jgi:hypothetical protein
MLRFIPCARLTDLRISLPNTFHGTTEILAPLHSQLVVAGPKFTALCSFSLAFYQLSLDTVLDVLACVPSVETLALHGHGIHAAATKSPAAVALFPQRLHNLDVDVRGGARPFFEHLRSLPTIPQLRSLKFFAEMDPEDCTAIALYLDRAGPALQSLSCQLWDTEPGKPFLLPVSLCLTIYSDSLAQRALRCCIHLRHFSIHVFGDQPPTYLVDLFSVATSSDLQSIKIVLHASHEVAAEELDQVLAHPRFSGLCDLSVIIRCGRATTFLTSEVRARMPLASARGIFN